MVSFVFGPDSMASYAVDVFEGDLSVARVASVPVEISELVGKTFVVSRGS
jgi:hypothetical protein